MKKINMWILGGLSGPALVAAPLLTSCSESAFKRFIKKYQKEYNDWYPLLTNDDNWNWRTSDDTTCSTEAQAIMMYSYGDGWDVWNTRLHQYGVNEQEIPRAEEDVVDSNKQLVLPTRSGNQSYKHQWIKTTNIKVGTYKLVESGLNKSNCAEVTTFSGSESNQDELYGQLNTLLGHPEYSWETQNPSDYRQLNPKELLVGKELKNWGFMSTSLSKKHAWKFLSNAFSGGYKNVVFYEIHVDENTKGGYISNNQHTFAGKQLNWTFEYQLLLQRKMKLTITDAWWDNTSEGKNVLYLKCNGSHN